MLARVNTCWNVGHDVAVEGARPAGGGRQLHSDINDNYTSTWVDALAHADVRLRVASKMHLKHRHADSCCGSTTSTPALITPHKRALLMSVCSCRRCVFVIVVDQRGRATFRRLVRSVSCSRAKTPRRKGRLVPAHPHPPPWRLCAFARGCFPLPFCNHLP